MFGENELQELVAFAGQGERVLSLYLGTDPTKRLRDEYKLILRSLLTQATARGAAPADVSAVERYFNYEYDGQGKGVAVFSCGARGLWKAHPLNVAVPSLVEVTDRPYVKPLADLLSEHIRYGLVVVDQEGARVFATRMGQIEEKTGILGGEVRKVKSTGRDLARSAGRVAAHIEEHAAQNMRDAAELTRKFLEGRKVERLIVAGTGDNIARFVPLLPKSLQERVVATLPMETLASEQQIQSAVFGVMDELKQKHQQELVEQVYDAATKGGHGVIGLADTLAALQEERVHHLLVHEGFEVSAFRCGHCGTIAAQEMARCAYCGGEMTEIKNAVDDIIHRTYERGAKVEVVADSPTLRTAGSIGAILRY